MLYITVQTDNYFAKYQRRTKTAKEKKEKNTVNLKKGMKVIISLHNNWG